VAAGGRSLEYVNHGVCNSPTAHMKQEMKHPWHLYLALAAVFFLLVILNAHAQVASKSQQVTVSDTGVLSVIDTSPRITIIGTRKQIEARISNLQRVIASSTDQIAVLSSYLSQLPK